MSKKDTLPDEQIVTYVKENGTEVDINCNPANLAKAKELGWKPKKGK